MANIEYADTAPELDKRVVKDSLGRNALLPVAQPLLEEAPVLELRKVEGSSCDDCPEFLGERAPASSDCVHFREGPPPECANSNSVHKQAARFLSGGGISTPDQ